jgi:hypothetical protein
MNLAIEILNKEIERREILLAVENNVLIQNDMSNEIGVLKDSVKNLALSGVSHQRELLELVTEIANSNQVYSNTRHKLWAKKLISSNCG